MLRCVLLFTVFLKLKDIGGNVLPPYDEFREVAMDGAGAAYRDLAGRLTQALKQALARRDTTLLGGPQRAAGLAGLLLPVGDGGASAHAQHPGLRPGSVQ